MASRPLALNPLGSNVGIGTDSPAAKLTVIGTALIGDGSASAIQHKCMLPGSLIIGSTSANYGGGNNWNANIAGLLLEAKANTEIAVHDAGTRLTSLMYFEGDAVNRITVGRDMGWGITPLRAAGSLTVNGALTPSPGNAETAGIMFPKDIGGGGSDAAWIRYYAHSGEACTLEIGIASDPDDFIYLKSSGGVKMDTLRLGDKWRLSGIGDYSANDEWLRLTDANNTTLSGGLAAGKLWTNQGQYLQSDLRTKQDVAKLGQVLDKVRALDAISCSWVGRGPQIGRVAQQVEAAFPQLVETGPDGMKGVNYLGFIAVLMQAIKEQQTQIDALCATARA